MVELHGWATICENYILDGDFDYDERLDKIIKPIRNHIESFRWVNVLVDLRSLNGEFHLAVSTLTNHRDSRIDEVLELFRYISQVAAGSYGLLYIRDDEDNLGRDNEFLVYVLAKGKMDESKDIYLSPFIPVVEDPWNGE